MKGQQEPFPPPEPLVTPLDSPPVQFSVLAALVLSLEALGILALVSSSPMFLPLLQVTLLVGVEKLDQVQEL